jgi:hypothetical protein
MYLETKTWAIRVENDYLSQRLPAKDSEWIAERLKWYEHSRFKPFPCQRELYIQAAAIAGHFGFILRNVGDARVYAHAKPKLRIRIEHPEIPGASMELVGVSSR